MTTAQYLAALQGDSEMTVKISLKPEELIALSSEELRSIAMDRLNSDTTRRLAGRELSERVKRVTQKDNQ